MVAIVFMDIENIHVMRSSLYKLRENLLSGNLVMSDAASGTNETTSGQKILICLASRRHQLEHQQRRVLFHWRMVRSCRISGENALFSNRIFFAESFSEYIPS